MKKTLLCGLCLCCVYMPVARGVSPLKGLYGGGALGLITLGGVSASNPVGPVVYSHRRLNGYRLSYSLFVGYEARVWGRFLLGGEVYYDFVKPRASNDSLLPSGGIPKDTVTKNALLGLAVKFGLQMTKNIATYLKMGPEFSSVTYTVTDTPGQSFSNKQRLIGFSVGPGIDFSLTPHLHLRVDWTFTANPTARFPDFHFSGGDTSSGQKVTLQTQAFRVGLSYTF